MYKHPFFNKKIDLYMFNAFYFESINISTCLTSGCLLRIFFSFKKKFFLSFLPFLGPFPMAYGGSQARGLIGAVATGLRQSHSKAGSEPRLQPTPQLTATPDP